MRTAAEFWAAARQRGEPTADDKALDADVILAAQVVLLAAGQDDVIVVTTNVAIWSDLSLHGAGKMSCEAPPRESIL